jgi:hypothetical protein
MKYEILSAESLVKMIVRLKKDDEIFSLPVSVDYFNNRVYFEEQFPDSNELEQEILSFLRPDVIERPEIPSDVYKHISDIESGNYGPDFKVYEGKE